MTNESTGATTVPKKGHAAFTAGWRLMIVGVVLGLLMGGFGTIPAIVFFGGMVFLIAGMWMRGWSRT